MLDYFNNIFEQFEEFKNYKYKSYNWDELKKQGRVEETSKEEDGFITVIRTFISHDGKTKITESDSSPTFDSQTLRLMDINNEIKEALKIEDYEKCVLLKKEKDQIKVKFKM